MINLNKFENGERPSVLFHMTSVNNLNNILKDGLLCNVDKKEFVWCDNKVFMFDGLENVDRLMELYEIMLPDDVDEDITVRNVILKIDCDKLDKTKFGIDDMMDLGKDGEIVSYTYDENIKPEYISVETFLEKTYTKEYLLSA